jgi:sialic acid synthase
MNVSETRSLKFAGIDVNDNSPTFVIAEIGHNHQGNLEYARELIRKAAECGASAAKFQKRSNKDLFTPAAYNRAYDSENAFGSTYGAHRDYLEFGEKEYKVCIEEANSVGILFFATAFDFQSADFLESLSMPLYKIASGDLNNHPLLEYIAKFQKPMIISTGGSDFEMIDQAVTKIRKFHNQIAILQCTASYPADFGDLNLRVISQLRQKYPENVIGYSGHDNGIAMSLAAYCLGARVVEKHFTLNRSNKGTDHAFSLEPQGMKKLIRDLERCRLAMGDGQKRILDCEIEPLRKMGKMIVAARTLNAGEYLTIQDLEFRSPAEGLSPALVSQVLGKRVIDEVAQYAPVKLENLTW